LPTASIAPAGVPVRADAEGGSSAQATYTQVFADADRDILLTLQSRPGGLDATPSEMRQPVTIDGWDDAYGTDGSLRLVALDPSGMVRLAGTGIDTDQAVSMIETMQRRAAGTPGWELSTEFDGDRVVAQMLLSPANTDVITQALGPAFEQVDVNGAQGWLNESNGRRALVWSPDGTTIVVLGVADERIDPLAVARSTTALIAADYESATTTEVPAGVGDGCDGNGDRSVPRGPPRRARRAVLEEMFAVRRHLLDSASITRLAEPSTLPGWNALIFSWCVAVLGHGRSGSQGTSGPLGQRHEFQRSRRIQPAAVRRSRGAGHDVSRMNAMLLG
jgi:hypothetical protein